MTRTAGRGTRHFILSIGSGYGVKIASIVAGIATLPIGVDAFGASIFGVWLTASTLLQYASSTSLGIPLAVVTAVSRVTDREQSAKIAAYGVRIVFIGASLLLLLGAALWSAFPEWVSLLFGQTGELTNVALAVALLLGITILLQPLNVAAAVLTGRHRLVARHSYDLTQIGTRLLALVVVAEAGLGLPALAALTVGADSAISIARLLHVVKLEHIPLHRYLFRRNVSCPGLLPSGMRFFILQIESTAIHNTDNLVISSILGPASVTTYAAPLKLISVASQLINTIQGPLWPAYSSAFARSDWPWIRKTHDRVIAVGLWGGGLIWVGSTLFAPSIIALWLGPTFPVNSTVILALGGYASISMWITANAILLNALDRTESQIVSGGAEAGINVVSSILLAPVLGLGGIAAGTLLGGVSVSAWYLPLDVANRTMGRVSPRFGRLLISLCYTLPVAVAGHLLMQQREHPGLMLPFILVALQLGFGCVQFWSEIKSLIKVR